MSYADGSQIRVFFKIKGTGDIRLGQMILSGQVSNSSDITSMPLLSANFRQIRSKLKVMLMIKSNRGFYQQSVGVTLRLMIGSGQILNHPSFHPCPPYLPVSGGSSQT